MSSQAVRAQARDSTFRITPVRPVAELRAEALGAKPPVEEGEFREPDLVDLATLDSTMQFDIRYATKRNFMGTIFYRTPRAFLQRPVAAALLDASTELYERGFGLLVYDAYRPWFVTKMFWDATPDSMKHFVAPPQSGSRHNRGAAVDVGLYDLDTGDVIPMPSGYDEFTERAAADYPGGTEAQRRHRRMLREAMEVEGFAVLPEEWWHFDYRDWREYPILDRTFEDIR